MRLSASGDIEQDRQVLQDTAGENEEMPNAVAMAEAIIEDVEDDAEGVGQTAAGEQEHAVRVQGPFQRV